MSCSSSRRRVFSASSCCARAWASAASPSSEASSSRVAEIGAGHAAGGVDPRRHHEGDVIGVDGLAGQAGDVEQRPQADLVRAAGQHLESEFGDDPVLADQRHDVGQGADGGDLHERRQPGVAPGLLAQRLDQLQRHADAGQMLVRIAAVGPLGIDDGEGARQFAVGLVVVGDDEVEAELGGPARRVGRADPAVHRHQHLRPLGVQAIDGRRLQPVAVAQPFGNEVGDVAAEQFQRAPQDHRRGDAVDVVVAVDDDTFPAGHGGEQAIHRRRQIGEAPRVVQVIE